MAYARAGEGAANGWQKLELPRRPDGGGALENCWLRCRGPLLYGCCVFLRYCTMVTR
jgi:hypothetical protein